MKRTPGTLEEIRIAEPCNASWERMQGDGKVRFCGECRKNVYNLSAMTHEEAEGWVHELEGRLCVRFYQRRDGTVLTSNCPVGVRKARLWLSARLAGIAAAFAGMFALGSKPTPPTMGSVAMPAQQFVILSNRESEVVMGDSAPKHSVMMGAVAPPRQVRMGRANTRIHPTMGAPAPPSSKQSSQR